MWKSKMAAVEYKVKPKMINSQWINWKCYVLCYLRLQKTIQVICKTYILTKTSSDIQQNNVKKNNNWLEMINIINKTLWNYFKLKSQSKIYLKIHKRLVGTA